MNAWIEAVDLANRFDCLNGVASGFLLSGCNREGEAVNNDVLDPHIPIGHEGVDQPGRDPNLVFFSSCLTLLING